MLFLLLLAIVVIPPMVLPKDKFAQLVKVSVKTWWTVGIIVLLAKIVF
jgi:hypothetical protein